MQGASLLDFLVASIATHTELSVLQDVVAEMRGNHLPPTAIAFMEQKVIAALNRAEYADAAFPGALDDALWDWQRTSTAHIAQDSAQ